MEVSQSTISRHLDEVHRKLANALVHGLAIRIENTTEIFHCDECDYTWNSPGNNTRVSNCEKCGSNKFHIHTQS